MSHRSVFMLILLGAVAIIGGCGGGGSTAAQVVSPEVVATTPGGGSTGASLNGALAVTFSEVMDPATINGASITVTSGGAPIAGSVTYSGTTAVFRPAANLAPTTSYTATVTTGAKDMRGVPLAAPFMWSFVTGTALDATPPAVVSTNPAGGAANVTSGVISVVFSEVMDPATITTTTFTLASGGTAVAGTVSYNGTTAIFTPVGGLSLNTTYTATITIAAKDLAGNPLAAPFTWSFTTSALQFANPPRVVTNSPAANATNVPVTANVSATFSKAMDPATVTAATFTLSNAAGAVQVNVTLDPGGTIAVLTPATQLAPNTIYTATVTAGAKDLTGIPLTSSFSWVFTTGITGDTIPPTVVSVVPAANATGVAVTSLVSATFSELLTPSTVTNATFTVSSTTGPVAGTVTLNGTTATFTPAAPLAAGTIYTATITSGVKDLAGNPLVGNFSWRFTTQ